MGLAFFQRLWISPVRGRIILAAGPRWGQLFSSTPRLIGILPRAFFGGLLCGLLASCETSGGNDPSLCPIIFEPVCAAVEPSFCQLGDCGVVYKTFDNRCFAEKSNPRDISRGACGYTPDGVIDPARFQPQPLRTSQPVQNPYSAEALRALYAAVEEDFSVRRVAVERSAQGVSLSVFGTVRSGCLPLELRQSARLGDSFGVTLTSQGPAECAGDPVEFAESLVLDPGRDPWREDYEYEVVMNGRMGRFTL